MFGWTVNRALTVVNPVFFLFHYSYSIHTIKNYHMFKIISVIGIDLFFFSFSFSERERETVKCLVGR